jgi:hypothetical protein
VVSLTSSSGGYINGRNSANLELLIDTKGEESVFRRRIDNTMAKRKKYKWTKHDLHNMHIKLRIE